MFFGQLRSSNKKAGNDLRHSRLLRITLQLERQPSNDLTAAWCGTGSINVVNKAVATSQRACRRVRGLRSRRIHIRRPSDARSGIEQAIEYILELRPDVQLHFSFIGDLEVASQAEGLRRLPLPAVVVVVRSGGAERSRLSIRPG